MPGATCAVKFCGNNSQKMPQLSFHSFPKDVSIRAAWIKFCNQGENWTPKKTSRICSVHFEPSDMEVNFRKELLNRPTKRTLKNHVVPCILNSEDKKNLREQQSNAQRQEILSQVYGDSESTFTAKRARHDSHVKNNNEVQEQISMLRKQVEHLKTYNNELLRRTNEQQSLIDDYKTKSVDLAKELNGHQNCIKEGDIHLEIKKRLNNVLSDNQLDLILNLKKKVKWSHDDIFAAFSLRYFSQKSYLFMKNNKYPLPDLSTLRRYASKFNIRNGLLLDVLQFMKIAANNMSPKEKCTVLMFDEMKVSSTYEYDEQNDEVIGPHKQMQVVMARSLFGQWKQQVFVDFDKKITSNLLLEIISALHNINYNVVAIVSDCGAWNQRVCRDLDVSMEKTFFLHPNTEQPIYCFADASHLLKLIRNWLLDTGFITADGKILCKKPLEELVGENVNLDVSFLYSLQQKHLTCVGTERQNVSLATQLLSHTTAKALLEYSSEEEASNLSHFIETVNNWFDLMNSCNLDEAVVTKKPYQRLEQQDKTLDDMYNLISSIRCIGKQSLEVFQKAILMSITSLKNLMTWMQNTYDISFILTTKVNRDALENLFRQIRTRGGLDDHPTPLNALYQLRILMLGKIPGIVQADTNYGQVSSDEEYVVVGSVFKQASVKPHTNSTEVIDPELSISSATSSGAVNNADENYQINNIENDGLEYFGGWLAKKFCRQYPDLCQYTYTLQREHDYCLPSSVTHILYGGLSEPSTEFKAAVEMLDNKFKEINRQSLRIKKRIVNRLTTKLKTHVDIPVEVTKSFVQHRVLMRIKYLNIKVAEKRKFRKVCKMEKTAT